MSKTKKNKNEKELRIRPINLDIYWRYFSEKERIMCIEQIVSFKFNRTKEFIEKASNSVNKDWNALDRDIRHQIDLYKDLYYKGDRHGLQFFEILNKEYEKHQVDKISLMALRYLSDGNIISTSNSYKKTQVILEIITKEYVRINKIKGTLSRLQWEEHEGFVKWDFIMYQRGCNLHSCKLPTSLLLECNSFKALDSSLEYLNDDNLYNQYFNYLEYDVHFQLKMLIKEIAKIESETKYIQSYKDTEIEKLKSKILQLREKYKETSEKKDLLLKKHSYGFQRDKKLIFPKVPQLFKIL